jgi:putative membrane protein
MKVKKMNKIQNAFKGMAMGIAEVIPGVSGGTIAFITGIYPKLILTIKSFDLILVGEIRKDGWNGLKRTIDLPFLVSLLCGMVIGLIIGILGVTYLYEHYPEPLWGFFFGLIIASSAYIARIIPKWSLQNIIIGIIGVIVAYGITVVSPAEGSDSWIYILLSGILAISALILPGISGSFILLLLGMYTVIIPALKAIIADQDFTGLKLVLIFAVGCIIGLAGFSRILHYLFQKYENATLACLTGFMIGSLNKIWPWRNPEVIMEKSTGASMNISGAGDLSLLDLKAFKILSEANVLPSDYFMSSPKTTITIISLVLGIAVVLLFLWADNKSKRSVS